MGLGAGPVRCVMRCGRTRPGWRQRRRWALGWRPTLTLEQALDWIVAWHKAVGAGADARTVTLAQIGDYRSAAA